MKLRIGSSILFVFLISGELTAATQHLVLFQFRDDASPEAVRQLLDEFDLLPQKVPGITGFQWGVNNSPEGLNRGFTHGFIMTFEDASKRDGYIKHPAHQDFVDKMEPLIQNAFVLDFDVENAPPPAEPGRVHHLVFFKFKEDVSEAKLQEIMQAFAALEKQVSGLLSYQAGRNTSPGKLSAGFTHGFLLTFINERARNDYVPHPAHKQFGKMLGPVLAEPLVLDFTVRPSRQNLFVTHGLEPYKVYQRDAKGVAELRFGGVAREGTVEARLVAGRRTVPKFDWQVVGKATKGSFEAVMPGVPTGGEYTVEVRLRDSLGNVTAHTDVANILVGDLWILAGQSNMQGVGNLVDVEEPNPLVHCFTMAHRWEIAKEPLHWLIDSPDPVHYGGRLKGLDEEGRRKARSAARQTRAKGAGLGLPFAKELVARTGVPIGLISSAHGGTSMEQWNPAGRDSGGATLYGSMDKQVKNAGGKVKGVLWYQGESDANENAVPKFAERFRELIAALRKDFNSPELPFYYVQIGRFVADRPSVSWDQIQELQRLAQKEIAGVAMVSVIDLPLDDLIHVGTQGLKTAGRRLAKIAHRNLFGESTLQVGPRLKSVQAVDGGRTIRVAFSDVNGGLKPTDKVEGFSLRRKDGKAILLIYSASVDPQAPNVVVLKLQSPVPEDALLHYGAGLDPVCNLVDEEDMAAPVFGPVAIERDKRSGIQLTAARAV